MSEVGYNSHSAVNPSEKGLGPFRSNSGHRESQILADMFLSINFTSNRGASTQTNLSSIQINYTQPKAEREKLDYVDFSEDYIMYP